MRTIDEPIFCLTTDTDWASDFALEDAFALFTERGIRATVFATHASAVLDAFVSRGRSEVEIHPNFLPGSSHGKTFTAVIDHMLRIVPRARSFRAHTAFDAAAVTSQMYARGFRYDSNLGLHFQPNLVPLRHASGLVRFPIFWEDDVHWHDTGGDWNVVRYLPAFLSPGLKILNVHPFFITTNIPHHDYYLRIKPHITTLSADTIADVRHDGPGVRTFLIALLDELAARGMKFHLLSELYAMFPICDFLAASPDGRAIGQPR